MSAARWRDNDLLLSLHIQPRAKACAFVGMHDERFKIRLDVPPVDGKANEALIRWLSPLFGVPKSNIELLSGQSSPKKTVKIHEPQQYPEWALAWIKR